MSRRTVSLTPATLSLLLLLPALAVGFPAGEQDNDSGPRPFLEFTKGGIRVNFGGYHAQAGLGGLLTGSRADGGLHASAGTPSGAHASAGLGGSLDGGPVGGLHARAGLGNGGPEAEAGLGGSLAGDKPQGELFARSTGGNLVASEKSKGKNIQVISRSKKVDDEDNAVPSSYTATDSSDGGIVKDSSSSASAQAISSATVTANDDSEKGLSPAQIYFRKRLREQTDAAALSKKISTDNAIASPHETSELQSKDQSTQTPEVLPTSKPKWKPQGIFARAVAKTDTRGNEDGNSGKRTLFDDIFNIPISALNAVNQLLRNHVGRK